MTWDLWVTAAPAALAWGAVAYKLPSLARSPAAPALRAYFRALLCLAMSMTLLVPTLYRMVGTWTGEPNAARLFSDCIGLVMAWNAVTLLLYQAHGDDPPGAQRLARRRPLVLVAILVAEVTLFVLAPLDVPAVDFVARYGDEPSAVAYLALGLSAIGWMTIDVARACWRHGAKLEGDLLRFGVRWVAAAGVLGFLYAAYNVAYIVAKLAGVGALPAPTGVSRALLGSATALIAIGSTMPDWGHRVSRWARHYRALRRLHPLWTELCRAAPHVALAQPPSAFVDAVQVRDIEFRLYRRVIEIRDARLALRPYLHHAAGVAADAAARRCGLSGRAADAFVEATNLAAAARARAAGATAGQDAESGPPNGGQTFDDELAWLLLVAEHFANPAVRQPAAGSSLVEDGGPARYTRTPTG